MATYTLSPTAKQILQDDTGLIVPGGFLYVYEAGTLNAATVYRTSSGTAHTQPIELDAAGRIPEALYLEPGASYKFVFTTADGVTIWTQDNIGAVPISTSNQDVTGLAGEALDAGDAVYLSDGSGGLMAGQWYKTDADLGYASLTPTVGMVPSAIASGDTGIIRLAGRITLPGPITAGAAYFLSATAGDITATAPTNLRQIGQAETTTEFIISVDDAVQSASSEAFGLSATASGNALTIALTTASGSTPTTLDGVTLGFRSNTVGTGTVTRLSVTAAETVVIPDTATLATSNNVAFRYWVVAFNDAGTVRLGVINCTTSTSIYPLAGWGIASSTTISTGADSAQVFYSDAGVTSKAYVVLGYVTYESGLATAGTYASAPTRVQVYTPDIALPGRPVQEVSHAYSTETTNSTSVAADTGLTATITPSSAANRVLVEVHQAGCDKSAGDAANGLTLVLVRASTTISTLVAAGGFTNSALRNSFGTCSSVVLDAPGVATATAYKTTFVNVTSAASVTVQSNSAESRLLLTELMA